MPCYANTFYFISIMMHLLPRITFVSRFVDQLKKMFLIQPPYDSLIVKRPCVKFLQVLSQSVRPNLIFFSLICPNKTFDSTYFWTSFHVYTKCGNWPNQCFYNYQCMNSSYRKVICIMNSWGKSVRSIYIFYYVTCITITTYIQVNFHKQFPVKLWKTFCWSFE